MAGENSLGRNIGEVQIMKKIGFLGLKSLHIDEKQFGRYNIDSLS